MPRQTCAALDHDNALTPHQTDLYKWTPEECRLDEHKCVAVVIARLFLTKKPRRLKSFTQRWMNCMELIAPRKKTVGTSGFHKGLECN